MSEDQNDELATTIAASTAEDLSERRRVQRELLSSIEHHLGMPEGFIVSLEDTASDWEFMVKFGVLCEAALTRTIVTALHRDEVFDFVSRSNQSQRLGLAEQLGLIDKADRQILETVATVRNSFAHRVENLGRTLHDFALAVSPQERADYVNKLLGRKDKEKFSERDDLSWLPYLFRSLLFDYGTLPLIALGTAGEKAAAEREQNKWLQQSALATHGLHGGLGGLLLHPDSTQLASASAKGTQGTARPQGLLDVDFSKPNPGNPTPSKGPD